MKPMNYIMKTNKYLVVDARGFIPVHHTADSLKEVSDILGSSFDPLKQLVFMVSDDVGIVKIRLEDPSLKVYSVWEEEKGDG